MNHLYLKFDEHHQICGFDGPNILEQLQLSSLPPPGGKVMRGSIQMLTSSHCNPGCTSTRPNCCFVAGGWVCQSRKCPAFLKFDDTHALLEVRIVAVGWPGIDFEDRPEPASFDTHNITFEVHVIANPGEPTIYAMETPFGIVAVTLSATATSFTSSASAMSASSGSTTGHSH